MSIIHKCYCSKADKCNCPISSEIIMQKFTSKESTIFWIDELVRVRTIEYADWAENVRRIVGPSGDELYKEFLSQKL